MATEPKEIPERETLPKGMSGRGPQVTAGWEGELEGGREGGRVGEREGGREGGREETVLHLTRLVLM